MKGGKEVSLRARLPKFLGDFYLVNHSWNLLLKMFNDIGKGVKDLFEDDYFHTQRLKIKTTNESQLCWLTEGELSSKGANASISASRKGSNLSLDRLTVKSDGRVFFEASFQTSEITKFTVSGEDGRQEAGKPLQGFGKLGCELRTSSVSGAADIDVVNGPVFRSNFVYNYQQLSAGAEVAINSRLEEKDIGPEISDINIGLNYAGPGWNLSAKTLDSFGALRISYLHTLSSALAIGSRLDYRLKGNSQKISVGTNYR